MRWFIYFLYLQESPLNEIIGSPMRCVVQMPSLEMSLGSQMLLKRQLWFTSRVSDAQPDCTGRGFIPSCVLIISHLCLLSLPSQGQQPQLPFFSQTFPWGQQRPHHSGSLRRWARLEAILKWSGFHKLHSPPASEQTALRCMYPGPQRASWQPQS